MNSLRKTSLFFVALFFNHLAFGQNTATFEASTNTKQVSLDGYFEVVFSLSGANGSQFAPPSFKDFTILAGPSTSSSMQIINGNVSREISYGYTLQPTKLGTLTIGSASVKANGVVLRTKPISIEVVKGAPKSNLNSGERFFVRVEPSKKQAYIGEQIMLDFKLYTRAAIEGYDIPEDPSYDGFYAVELRRFNSNTMQETLNGQQYATKVLRRIALFPQQAGKLKIEPFRIQLAVVDDDGSTGFFFNRSVKPVYFTTNSIEIDVNSLPNNEPDGFCGAVGSFEMQAGIDRKAVTTDDAVTLTIVLTGNGDVKRIQPPSLVLSDSFEVYEPKMVSEKSDEKGSEVVSEKTFEYLILPKYAGQYVISPKISYFNIKTNQYSTFGVGPFSLEVRAGTGKRSPINEKSGGEVLNDILPIKNTTAFSQSKMYFSWPVLLSLLLIIPVIVFVSYVFVQKSRQVRAANPTYRKVQNSSAKEAQRRLATAQQQLLMGNSRGFYDEVSKAFLSYACDKTGLPLSQFSKENVREKLSTLEINATTVEEFVKIVQTCETALFAGMDNSASMTATYENAISVISSIENELRANSKD